MIKEGCHKYLNANGHGGNIFTFDPPIVFLNFLFDMS